MLIQFKRSRLKAILDALEHGRHITCQKEERQWDDNELLALAGACMAQMMFRREVEQCETTDEPLQFHLRKPYDQLSSRLTVALNYAMSVASAIDTCPLAKGDKTYRMEIYYDHAEFHCEKPSKKNPDNESPAPDDKPPSDASESAADDEAMRQAA
ncbi:MAG: hypothetical protein MI923_28735 [Phycisphaerales bacterium]|nr:hypothetical protein [Phycisphaerales bacterium]